MAQMLYYDASSVLIGNFLEMNTMLRLLPMLTTWILMSSAAAAVEQFDPLRGSFSFDASAVDAGRVEFLATSDLGRTMEFVMLTGDGNNPALTLHAPGETVSLNTSFGGTDFASFGAVETLVDGKPIEWYEPSENGLIEMSASVELPNGPIEPFTLTVPATLERLLFIWQNNSTDLLPAAGLVGSDLLGTAEVSFEKEPGIEAYKISRLSFEFVPEPTWHGSILCVCGLIGLRMITRKSECSRQLRGGNSAKEVESVAAAVKNIPFAGVQAGGGIAYCRKSTPYKL